MQFDPAVVQQIIASNSCQPNDTTVHLVFQPGLYETGGCFFRSTYTRETRAVVWWAGTTNPALMGTVGWTDPNSSRQPGRSEALGAGEITTNRLWVVGTGWLTPDGFSRAYRQGVDKAVKGKKPICDGPRISTTPIGP